MAVNNRQNPPRTFDLVTTAMGMIKEAVTIHTASTPSPSASGYLTSNSVYRLTANQDHYIKQDTGSNPNTAPATRSNLLLLAGQELFIQTDSTNRCINVTKVTTSGEVNCARMAFPRAQYLP